METSFVVRLQQNTIKFQLLHLHSYIYFYIILFETNILLLRVLYEHFCISWIIS